ncbi:hypothetical protein LQG66_26205 [Bradyrhizobium ontarionense]|uniref:DUF2946 domain-containing protein n=1 Tax=Bradyrhizobium ontarionense TaxID=2898149 RepID=A0ABY3R760_9BRAD|nr:DUF2946 family protein [Bradyrhizobium sp. A19]UFZ02745.1 hypothetical protein LQG66_26205 [Bradyrhizobium sp. A19]
MRQRLQLHIPAFLLALMMQIIAPVAASWAAASAVSDPLTTLGDIAICHSGSGEAGRQPDQTDRHVHDGVCALSCLAAHASATLDTPNIAVAAPCRSPSTVVWHNMAQDLEGSLKGTQAKARAPPSSNS